MYNYLEEMKKDVLAYLEENGGEYEGLEREEVEESLNDDLLDKDEITGNGGDLYFCTAEEAKKAVQDNIPLAIEALREFCVPMETVGEKFLQEEWGYFDVTIRCYLLGTAIAEALEEYHE